MNNSKVYKYINSKDIQKYLEDINYQFSVPEYAYLIRQCQIITLKEKHMAFHTLMETTESCTIQGYADEENWDLHTTIKSMTDLETQFIEILMSQEDNCFYTCACQEDRKWFNDEGNFISFDKAYKYALESAKDEYITSFMVTKQYIDNDAPYSSMINAYYNCEGELLSLDIHFNEASNNRALYEQYEICDERFFNMYFEIPIPFEKGDIVCDCITKIPFVILSTTPWFRKENPPKKKSTKYLCSMDMLTCGYSADSDSLNVNYDWMVYPYLNLEYCTKKLTGFEQILNAYSLFIKEEIAEDTFSEITQFVTARSHVDKLYKHIDWGGINETKKLFRS